ncbi:RNB domain-containing ribonuclease [Pararhizobium sp. BT-229]|uniref:RNB domain-containing ribonuclease n=1 Tax=Pararhizobium sp. BT-229 TaxID=2986923 RepID=UPI0021F7B432|nr:RNB domain-containing ribonuclease [Pararhizobium sp. BT-229]MCV9964084.1 RNB domain-containing ribonuclease [Pararhizobium sp. BT-229]
MAVRHFTGITIDAEHSKDLDDAIRVEEAADGWLVEVCVPLVSGSVPRNSSADVTAREVGFTRYNAFSVRKSMLDPVLAEEELTLAPGRLRDVLVMRIGLDQTLAVTSFEFDRGRFESMARLSHEGAGDMLAQGSGPVYEMLVRAWTVAVGLLERRRRSGSITWFSEKSGVVIDEDGRPVFLDRHHGVSRAYLIVQEFMILANSAAAEWCVRGEVPIVFRNQRGNSAADRAALAHDLELISQGDPQADAAGKRLSLMLGRAFLSRTASGHFALGLPVYAWFSSPLRRYADLVNQRAVIARLDGDAAPYAAEEIEAVAEHLNQLVTGQQAEASSGYAAESEARARKHQANGRLAGLSSTDMTAVIKQAKQSHEFGEALVAEIADRLDRGVLTAKDKGRLVLSKGNGSDAAKATLFSYLETATHDAISILTYLEQDREISPPSWREHMKAGRFAAEATLSTEAGVLKFDGEGETKKAASQRAAVGLLSRIADFDWTPPDGWSKRGTPAAKAQTSDAKGALISYCQVNRHPAPVFDVTSAGPSHAPIFTAIASVGVGPTRIASSPAAATSKKEAEQKAATALLVALKGMAKPETTVVKAGSPASPHDNPKNALQELCQKRGWALPVYDCEQTGTPPTFVVTASVKTAGRTVASEPRSASSKKGAEKFAAEALLALL